MAGAAGLDGDSRLSRIQWRVERDEVRVGTVVQLPLLG